jgi:hypothetical protein
MWHGKLQTFSKPHIKAGSISLPALTTEFGRQMLQKIEVQKQTSGLFPQNLEGNLADRNYTNIGSNDFFYVVDSARKSFTLKILNENGLPDIYGSMAKQWIRTDK